MVTAAMLAADTMSGEDTLGSDAVRVSGARTIVRSRCMEGVESVCLRVPELGFVGFVDADGLGDGEITTRVTLGGRTLCSAARLRG